MHDEEFFDQFLKFIDHLKERGFEKAGHGSFREVYVRKGVVIKIPSCFDGAMDNYIESKAWHKYRNRPTNQGLQLAPCRFLPNGCLMMVTVDAMREGGIVPPWNTSNADGDQVLDANQCGWYRERVVAYDYAIDVTERRAWERELGFSGWFQRSWFSRRQGF